MVLTPERATLPPMVVPPEERNVSIRVPPVSVMPVRASSARLGAVMTLVMERLPVESVTVPPVRGPETVSRPLSARSKVLDEPTVKFWMLPMVLWAPVRNTSPSTVPRLVRVPAMMPPLGPSMTDVPPVRARTWPSFRMPSKIRPGALNEALEAETVPANVRVSVSVRASVAPVIRAMSARVPMVLLLLRMTLPAMVVLAEVSSNASRLPVVSVMDLAPSRVMVCAVVTRPAMVSAAPSLMSMLPVAVMPPREVMELVLARDRKPPMSVLPEVRVAVAMVPVVSKMLPVLSRARDVASSAPAMAMVGEVRVRKGAVTVPAMVRRKVSLRAKVSPAATVMAPSAAMVLAFWRRKLPPMAVKPVLRVAAAMVPPVSSVMPAVESSRVRVSGVEMRPVRLRASPSLSRMLALAAKAPSVPILLFLLPSTTTPPMTPSETRVPTAIEPLDSASVPVAPSAKNVPSSAPSMFRLPVVMVAVGANTTPPMARKPVSARSKVPPAARVILPRSGIALLPSSRTLPA